MNLLILAQETVAPARSGAPLRVFAAILLVAVLCGLVWVLRHLGKIKRELAEDDVIPTERGPRKNMILVVCALTFAAVCLLLLLIVKA
ncbi:MAG: hypothetical protein ACJ8HQ_03670 [Chthoniobacterales bacterium]